jgi:hypothetical protein
MELKKINKFIIYKRPLWKASLKTLGIKYPSLRVKGTITKAYSLKKAPYSILVKLFYEAKNQYKLLVKIHHPDKGGNACTFSDITYCYKYLKTFFKKEFGIE